MAHAMARLVVNPGSPAAWEIQLKPGANFIGRGFANDVKIPDGSVSGSHCQIVLNDGVVMIKDLGSTNGTFINRAAVVEAVLETGQTIHLGGVEMRFYGDSPAEEPLNRASVLAPNPAKPPALRVGVARPQVIDEERLADPPPAVALAPPLISEPPVPPPMPSFGAASQTCKFHPKAPARFYCSKCRQAYCELCVALRTVERVKRKFCRHCGAECAPLQVRLQPAVEKGFFQRVPGAFGYPVRGGGVFIVIIAVAIMGLFKAGQALMSLGTIRTFIMGLILEIATGGYLFAYLQSILHSTSAEDRELPELPGIGNFLEDLLMPFLKLLGLVLFCFGPALGIFIWIGASRELSFIWVAIAAMVFGYLYFPMALLAVAILDSVAAANPLVVIPSILKAPLEYICSLVLLGVAFAFQGAGAALIALVFREGWTTHSMGQLVAMMGCMALVSFASLYLLVVAVHALGLIYVAKKEQLGWHSR